MFGGLLENSRDSAHVGDCATLKDGFQLCMGCGFYRGGAEDAKEDMKGKRSKPFANFATF